MDGDKEHFETMGALYRSLRICVVDGAGDRGIAFLGIFIHVSAFGLDSAVKAIELHDMRAQPFFEGI